MLILPLFLYLLKFEICLLVLSVLYFIGLFPLHEFKTAHLNSACGVTEHKDILKAKPEVAHESHTSIKDIFGFTVGYSHLVNGARAIFLLSNVLQTFLHLWLHLYEFSVVILVSRSYLHSSVYLSSFWNQNIFENILKCQNFSQSKGTIWCWALRDTELFFAFQDQ